MRARLVGFQLTVVLTCPRCHLPVPVNGLAERIRCPSCGTHTDLPAALWSRLVPRWRVARVLAAGPGGVQRTETEAPTVLAAELRWVEVASAEGRPAGALAGLLLPEARTVSGEGLDRDGCIEAATPVLLGCMGCGGGLPVDGAARVVDCRYCGASNFLPDAVWRRFHAVPTIEPFVVVSRLDAGAMLRARVADPGEARRLAARAPFPADVFETLAGSDCDGVRARLARNPRLPPALQRRLARDAADAVRESLVERPDLDPTALARLARLGHRAVRERVARRADTPPALLGELVADPEWLVRQHAVAHPAAPVPALAACAAAESDGDVLRALCQRADLGPVLLSALARSENRDARLAAARHPRTAPADLQTLADPHDRVVLEAIAAHPAAPLAALRVAVHRGGLSEKLARAHPTWRAARWLPDGVGPLALPLAMGALALLAGGAGYWVIVG